MTPTSFSPEFAVLFLALTLLMGAFTAASTLKRYDAVFEKLMAEMHPHLGPSGHHPDHPEYRRHRAPLFFGILTATLFAAFLLEVFIFP